MPKIIKIGKSLTVEIRNKENIYLSDGSGGHLATWTELEMVREIERLREALEHYAEKDKTWARIPTEDVMGGQVGSSGYLSIYQAGAKGWRVAQEALAGTKEENNA